MKESLSAEALVAENCRRVEESIAEACAKAGRAREEVTLLAVTKTVAPSLINAAIAEGIREIGENRVQEFLSKKDDLHLDGVKSHLIGHLQTNKINKIVGQVQMIQSVDSIKVAQGIGKESVKQGIVTDVLAEVNIGSELTKTGAAVDEFDRLIEEMASISGIHVCGMMAIPPILETEKEKRQIFSELYKLFIDIRSKNIDNIDMNVLSMGMSGDYLEAILEGSTMVRVGSALFGRRVY